MSYFFNKPVILLPPVRDLLCRSCRPRSSRLPSTSCRDENISADKVIGRDDTLDALEIDIDELCCEILALEKPVAGDLRFVAAALKIVKDIERVGDIAVNITERTIELTEETELRHLVPLPSMAADAQTILRLSLDAFVNLDERLACSVIESDRKIDLTFQHILQGVLRCMLEDPEQISRWLKLIFVAKHLERVGDHSKNIAQMVIFMVRGPDVRHPSLK
jgi:phosphate transport system protein